MQPASVYYLKLDSSVAERGELFWTKELEPLAASSQPIILVGGTFDGVHVGHQTLIAQAQQEACAVNGKVVVMTFDRHPASLLRPVFAPRLLTTTEEKVRLLQELDIDAVLLLSFDHQLAALSATEFITQLKKALPTLKTITVGSSWSFGRGGEGNIDLLKELGKKLHFSVMTIDPVEVDGVAVSSTRIRRALIRPDLQEVTTCLGRSYLMKGKVVEGNKKAREFGFPTANLLLPPRLQLPANGVYAVSVKRGRETYQGIANIGHCPTLSPLSFQTTVEAHLFNFEDNLYEEELTVQPIAYLRPEIAFPSLEELRLQIVKDVEVVKEIFIVY
jgi:riboflavin kinase/FMN adenylyltransferase